MAMTEDRLAKIRELNSKANDHTESAVQHCNELLAEVDRLRAEMAAFSSKWCKSDESIDDRMTRERADTLSLMDLLFAEKEKRAARDREILALQEGQGQLIDGGTVAWSVLQRLADGECSTGWAAAQLRRILKGEQVQVPAFERIFADDEIPAETVRTLRRELAGARKDSERLDWLGDHMTYIEADSTGWVHLRANDAWLKAEAESIRAAIDAAREGK